MINVSNSQFLPYYKNLLFSLKFLVKLGFSTFFFSSLHNFFSVCLFYSQSLM